MEFNSFVFIMLWLPIFIGSMIFIKQNKVRNILILLFSLCFYLINAKSLFVILISIILLTYLFSKKVYNNKVIYTIYLLLVISLLSFFKYGNYLHISKIIFPIGLSFYTFTAISYISDIYYGKIQADTLLNVSTYITFFPTIISGPILRFEGFKNYLSQKEINTNTISEGLREFILGLFKKVVIANSLAMMTDILFAPGFALSKVTAVFAAIAFMLQIYYDFSGYSNMAIGIAKMIGYDIPKNFDHPYWAKNIQDFWRRWHISLSFWFRDYVYIPLGGNRVTVTRWILNTLIVWGLTGIWHGSTFNFILWGLYNGVLLIGYKFIKNKIQLPVWLSWLITQGCVCVGFLIFKTVSLSQLKSFVKALIRAPFMNMNVIRRYNVLYKLYAFVLALIGLLPIYEKIEKKYPVLMDIGYILLFIISLVLILSGSYSSFIYANF